MYFIRIFLIILFSLYFQSRKKAKKGDNLDDLKQELDIDFHKISLEQLYQRFSTNPDNVSMTVQLTVNCCSLYFLLYCMHVYGTAYSWSCLGCTLLVKKGKGKYCGV